MSEVTKSRKGRKARKAKADSAADGPPMESVGDAASSIEAAAAEDAVADARAESTEEAAAVDTAIAPTDEVAAADVPAEPMDESAAPETPPDATADTLIESAEAVAAADTPDEAAETPVDTVAPSDSAEATEDSDAPADPAEPSADTEGPIAASDDAADAESDTEAAASDAAEDEELSAEPMLVADQPTDVTTEQIVEAILFGADTPLPPARIVDILGTGSARDVRKYVDVLNQRYAETGASFRIEKLAGGYQILTLPAFNAWLKRLKQARQESKLSQAAMETLAVVAYKQPVVRAEIESIRGVAAGEMLNRLRELGLVKIVGRAEDVGHPLLYGTTKRFLDVFGLGSLDDLPTVEELKAPD